MLEKGQDALFRGDRVHILQKADPNGLRYIIRFQGQPVAVRGAELSPIPTAENEDGEVVEAPEAPKPKPVAEPPPQQNAVPPVFMMLKQKITKFSPTNWDSFCEILLTSIQMQVIDPNTMSNEMGVSVSNLLDWSRRILRPPPHMMREAVNYINQNIGTAIAEYQDRARTRLQEQVNQGYGAAQTPMTAENQEPSPNETRTVRTSEAPANIKIMEVAGQTYTIEYREQNGIIEAKCKEMPHLATRADNMVDMTIDMKRLLVEKPHVPDGEGYAGDRGLQENPPAPEPPPEPVAAPVPAPEPPTPEPESPPAAADVSFPDVPPADAGLPQSIVEPDAPFEKRPGAETKHSKKLEEPLSEVADAPPPKPERKVPNVTDSLDLLSKIKDITG